MTVASALYNFLDTLPECNISGWKLFDELVAITGRETYPNTLLQYARRYADMAGAEFVCVDRNKSVYHYKPGYKISGALGGKE
jgi:hypothetical protein